MAQRQAQVDDVRWSRLQTELASSQNLSVMIFTIFTVIFLPLTFFTGLFGMNTSEWQDENVPSLGFIGSISLPASIVLIVVSLVAAFSNRVQGLFRSAYKHVKNVLVAVQGWLLKIEPEARRLAKKRRKEKQEKQELRERRMKDKAYDFWATVKKERATMYQIPTLNKQRSDMSGASRRTTWRMGKRG